MMLPFSSVPFLCFGRKFLQPGGNSLYSRAFPGAFDRTLICRAAMLHPTAAWRLLSSVFCLLFFVCIADLNAEDGRFYGLEYVQGDGVVFFRMNLRTGTTETLNIKLPAFNSIEFGKTAIDSRRDHFACTTRDNRLIRLDITSGALIDERRLPGRSALGLCYDHYGDRYHAIVWQSTPVHLVINPADGETTETPLPNLRSSISINLNHFDCARGIWLFVNSSEELCVYDLSAQQIVRRTTLPSDLSTMVFDGQSGKLHMFCVTHRGEVKHITLDPLTGSRNEDALTSLQGLLPTRFGSALGFHAASGTFCLGTERRLFAFNTSDKSRELIAGPKDHLILAGAVYNDDPNTRNWMPRAIADYPMPDTTFNIHAGDGEVSDRIETVDLAHRLEHVQRIGGLPADHSPELRSLDNGLFVWQRVAGFNGRIDLFSLTGALLHSDRLTDARTATIDLRREPAGVYFVRYTDAAATEVIRIVVIR